jgi:DNA repair protein RadC
MAAATVGLVVQDHVIIGRDGYASFKNLGLL